MANGSGNNDKNGISLAKLIGVLVIALGGTVGANSWLVRNATVQVDAQDRFTGTQASALKNEIRAHQDRDELIDDALAAAIAINNQKISRLNAQYEAILSNQNRILDKLDGK